MLTVVSVLLRDAVTPKYLSGFIFWFSKYQFFRFALFIALVVYMALFAGVLPSMAANTGALSGLDYEDSLGYLISNYSIDHRLDVLNTNYAMESLSSFLVIMLWEIYRWSIGLCAYVVDFTLGFGWVKWLAFPIEKAALELDSFLNLFPMVREMLITLAVGLGLLRVYFGHGAKGFAEILFALIAWGVSAAILVNPVSWLTGPTGFITRATTISKELGNEVASGVTEKATMGTLIIDIFIRKPHQLVAYGELVDGGNCEETYNGSLSKSSEDLANAMLSCSADYVENIKHPGPLLLVVMIFVLIGALLLIAIAVVGAIIALVEVANMLIAGLVMVWELFRSVGPGGSYRGLITVFISMGGSALVMYLMVILTAIYLGTVEYVFNEVKSQLILVFVVVDIVLLVGIIVLISQRARLAKKLERMKEKFGNGSKIAQNPRRLGFGKLGGRAVVGGVMMGAGQRFYKGNEGSSSKINASGAKSTSASRAVSTPIKSVTRKVTRPGYWSGKANAATVSRLGVRHPAVKNAVKNASYLKAERKWEKRHQGKFKSRTSAQNKRPDGQYWTWAGARRANNGNGNNDSLTGVVGKTVKQSWQTFQDKDGAASDLSKRRMSDSSNRVGGKAATRNVAVKLSRRGNKS